MSIQRLFSTLTLAALFALSSTSYADDLEDRVNRLERISNSKVMLELTNQIRQLQSEVRQLRGQLEQTTRELKQLQQLQQEQHADLQQRQKELFADVDRRIHRLEIGDTRATTAPIHRDGTQTEVEPMQTRQLQHSVAAQTKNVPDKGTEVSAYKAAFDLLKAGRYQQAVDAFTGFMESYPDGVYADNSQYWLGEANYVIRNFDAAQTEFNKVIENFPKSPKAADALLKIGYIHYERGDWKNARETLEKVRRDHPRASAAGLADKRLERMEREGR